MYPITLLIAFFLFFIVEVSIIRANYLQQLNSVMLPARQRTNTSCLPFASSAISSSVSSSSSIISFANQISNCPLDSICVAANRECVCKLGFTWEPTFNRCKFVVCSDSKNRSSSQLSPQSLCENLFENSICVRYRCGCDLSVSVFDSTKQICRLTPQRSRFGRAIIIVVSVTLWAAAIGVCLGLTFRYVRGRYERWRHPPRHRIIVINPRALAQTTSKIAATNVATTSSYGAIGANS